MKLNTQKVRERLQELDCPVSWLARRTGKSYQALKHQLDSHTVKDADLIAKALGVKPVSIIIFEA